MFKEINIKKSISFGKIITAIFYTTIIIALVLKKKSSFMLQSFDRRIISEATISGIDVGLRTNLVYQSVAVAVLSFVFFFLIFLGIDWVLTKVYKQTGKGNLDFEAKFFQILSLIGVITVVHGMFGSHTRTTLLLLFCIQVLLGVISIMKLISIKLCWRKLTSYLSNRYFIIWLLLNSFVFMFYLGYIGRKIPIFTNVPQALYYVIGFILNFIVFFALFSVLIRRFKEEFAQHLIITCALPLFISPIFFPLSNEIYLIFNQKEIFFITPKGLFLSFILISIAGTGAIYFISRRKTNIHIQSVLGNVYYPLLLIIFTSIVFRPPVTISPPGELFESGNPGIAIDQLFRYGKIPLLETFNAHAVSELAAPFLYSIINGYQEWGSFLYNTLFENLVYIVIGYYFLRKLISNELALLSLSFFPFGYLSDYLLPEYYSMGLLGVFVLHRVIQSPSLKSYLLFCFALFFTFLWRFDLGASVIPAAMITLGLYWILYRQKRNLKNLIISGVITGGFWFLAFIILSYLKDVPVVFRLKELLAVVSSNQIWGYRSLGDADKLNYSLFYIIVPAITVLFFGYLLIKTSLYNKYKPEVFSTISFLLLFTLLNFPRGLVRHSLIENTASFIVGFLAIPLAYLPYLIWSKKSNTSKYAMFTFVGIVYFFVVVLSVSGMKMSDNSLVAQSIKQFSSFKHHEKAEKKINRYVEPIDYTIGVYGGLKDLFDQTMEPDETFIDFSNAPYMYVHTKRETPMYTNQTPVFLSDETTQRSFLEEIKPYSIPYVVFADKSGYLDIDDVPNHIRSYRVSEYIYNHYVPFINVNGFDVWVEKDKKALIESKIRDLPKKTNEIIVYNSESSNSKIGMLDVNGFKETEEGLELETGSVDPQISNLFSDLEEVPLLANSLDELEIEYSTKKGGNIQIFFLLNNNSYNDYESTDISSSSFETKKSKKIVIPFAGRLKDIRLDPPVNDTFVVHSVILRSKSNEYKPLKVPTYEDTDIGWVPYYWGEKDTLNAKNKAAIQTNITNNQIVAPGISKNYSVDASLNKKKGNYVHLRLKSNEIGESYKVTVEYGSGEDSLKGGYSFNIVADGSYYDYLIRVSSQYNWYRSSIKSIVITSEKETVIDQVNILKGD